MKQRRGQQKSRSTLARELRWLDELPVAAVAIDETLRIRYANVATERLTGYSRKQLLGPRMRVERFLAPGVREAAEKALRQLWSGVALPARGAPFPVVLQRRSGEQLPVTGSSRWIEIGGLRLLLACVVDAPALSGLYEALAEREQRYRTLVELFPDAITVTDLQGNVLAGTGPIARLAGYAGVEEVAALGLTVFDLVAPEDRALARENTRRTLEEGTVRNVTYHLIRKDGSRFPVELSAALIRDVDGRPTGFIGVTRDVSEHHRLLAEKDALSARVIGAQEAERARIARELHDGVGQLLTAAKLEAGRLTRAAGDAQRTMTVAERISERVGEALDLVRTLAHGLRPSVLDDLGLDCALETLAAQTASCSGIRCRARCDEAAGLPASATTTIFRIAQEALANVMRHANASAAWVTLKRTRRQVVLTVEDDGCGMHDEQRPGKGLGIVSMRERAAHLGGVLSVGGRRGGGTRVVARLPLAAAPPRSD